MRFEREEEEEEEKRRRRKQRKEKQKEESKENKFFKYIERKSKGISYDLLRKYFNFEIPTQLTKKLFEIKDKIKIMILQKRLRTDGVN